MAQRNQRIKILYTIPNFDTAGSGKAVLKLAQNLDTTIFEPHIMCMHDRGAFFDEVKQSGIPVHLVQYTTPMKPYLRGLWNCYKISKELRKIAPDIIHSFHYAADYSEPLAAKMAGIKWVYTKKNMNWGEQSKNGWKIRTFLADAIAAQNTVMLKEFFPNLKKVHLIPRGVDTIEFQPSVPKLELRKQWGIADEKRILICVANLVPIKGIDILLKSFAEATNIHKDWVLFIVGDHNSEYGLAMMKLAKELRLYENVIFTGKQLNINEYLNIAEVFVLPTLNEGRKEGSPVSLLEAMASGIYVLGSNVPGINDQLNVFPNHIFRAGNIEELQQKLNHVFKFKQSEIKLKGEQFRKHVLANYSIEKEVERSQKLYLEIV